MYESFCTDAFVDDIPDMNKDKRIVIVGSAVHDKLSSLEILIKDTEENLNWHTFLGHRVDMQSNEFVDNLSNKDLLHFKLDTKDCTL